jgi:tRNA G18 (ribose-2'-O)-methylase SpoU
LSPTCCDPLYRKAIRTSMGAALRVPFARADEWPAILSSVRAAGFTLVALTPAVEAAADHRVRIAISGQVDSLNVAVAASIAMHVLKK